MTAPRLRLRLLPIVVAFALMSPAGAVRAGGPPSSGERPTAGDRTDPAGGARVDARARGATPPVAVDRTPTRGAGSLQVRSPQLRPHAPIPSRHTAYGDNVSPVLEWDPVDGARAYALLVEDPDAPRAEPFVHWIAWNLPADVHRLPEGIPAVARPASPHGLRQGLNDRGGPGYFGPRPPAGHGTHRYHFQVFALDRPLDLPDSATREDLLRALDGHVLAKGELVATSTAPGH